MYPIPRPEDCPHTLEVEERGKKFHSAAVIVKILLGRCPSANCYSELFATMRRKSLEAERARRAWELRLATELQIAPRIRAGYMWRLRWRRRYYRRRKIRKPNPVSLLTEALRQCEQDQESEDADDATADKEVPGNCETKTVGSDGQ